MTGAHVETGWLRSPRTASDQGDTRGALFGFSAFNVSNNHLEDLPQQIDLLFLLFLSWVGEEQWKLDLDGSGHTT